MLIKQFNLTPLRYIRGYCASVSVPHAPKRHPYKMFAPNEERGTLEVNDADMVSIELNLKDEPGSLENALRTFWKHDINLTHIESKPVLADQSIVSITTSFSSTKENEKKTKRLLESLKLTSGVDGIKVLPNRIVPWFPQKIQDLDLFSQKTLDAGAELESDHPGFNDPEYRKRRGRIVSSAGTYKYGLEIPRQSYSKEEVETWGIVYDKLGDLFPKYACKEFLEIFPQLQGCGYARDNIPQLEDISQFLKAKTGFQLRPVAGLLSARDFLNALAFRCFYSTQYIRHHTKPLYTPEPDICHELLGHVPLFANPDFADFSHEIGLASLGASDADIKRLATCYWFSVEFGILKENDDMKAYGAGLLSSFGELEFSCKSTRPGGDVDHFPNYLAWDPNVAADTTYPITTYQPTYFVADSMADAKEKMRDFCESSIKRPFHVRYDYETHSVTLDRPVKRGNYTVTLQN